MPRPTLKERIIAAALGLVMLLAAVAWWETAPSTQDAGKKQAAAITATNLVDQSTYATAQRLAQLAVTPEEQAYAQSALRIADHELDLAFTQALRDVDAHPPTLNGAAAAIQARIVKSQALLNTDQQRVNDLTGALAQAKAEQKDNLQVEMDLAQSQLELNKDELEGANQDLVEAGGNPRQQIVAITQEHEAQSKSHAGPTAAKAVVEPPRGSIGRIRDWRELQQKRRRLDDAATKATEKGESLRVRRATLAASLETTKGGISELAQRIKAAKEVDMPSSQSPPGSPRTPEDAAALLSRTKAIAADQKILTLLDRRIADQHRLALVYGRWSGLIVLQSHAIAYAMLIDALIVSAVLIALLILDGWLQRLLDRPKLDRRQVETLRSITRASLRIVAVLIILLIVIGTPSQFATTIGIIGAGLTVALKDFIVAFCGGLVLMGRNGIRLGDWVEINGVSGEVTELGMFRTVLLETGNWSDSGHPTGRRVTFTNSFAIEGHYFNFSTSGQWLWDELKVVVPLGRDPYPIVDAITKQVVAATAEGSLAADLEWRRAVPAQRGIVFSGTPRVNVKPVVGGVEIAVRYITRANERFMLRAKLYKAAVDMLGAKPAASASP